MGDFGPFLGDFGQFLRLFDHRIHIKVDIELIFIENVKFKIIFHIKLVLFKNIDIYEPKSIIFGVYAQIWAYSILLITQPIFIKLYVFRRLVAISRAPKAWF